MQLIHSFIRNPVKVAVSVLLVVLFGIIAMREMPLELTPQVERPYISVFTNWPGAGPEEIEAELILPQELQLNAIPGMVGIEAECGDSFGRITMEFEVGTDMSEALIQVTGRLQQVTEYPEDAWEPTIWLSDNSRSPVISFSLINRPPDPEHIRQHQVKFPGLATKLDRILNAHNPTLALEWANELADEHPELATLKVPTQDVAQMTTFVTRVIADRLSRVSGVAQVRSWGGLTPEMQVVIDPYRMAGLKVTVADLREALRTGNRDTPAGDIDAGRHSFKVKTKGRYVSPEQVEDQIVKVRDGSPTFVRDFAEARLGYRRGMQASRHFNSPSMWIGVTKMAGANIFEVNEGVKRVAEQLNAGILKDRNLMLHLTSDETSYVSSALGLVQKNIVYGGLLTVIVLLVFLRDIRSTLVVAAAIPVSIIGTFLLLSVLGRSLNAISLAGMAFAVGMLVDNAVVVLENIFRHRQTGEDGLTASIRGTKEVWGAALSSTLTTMAVFIPILFVREEAGQLFRDIALAISCGVGLSLVVSVVVIPTAAARISRSRLDKKPRLSWITGPIDWLAARFVTVVVEINVWLQQSKPRRLVTIIGFVAASAVLIYCLLPSIEYLPKGNRNLIGGNMYPKPGFNVDELLRIGRMFHDRLRPYAEVAPGSAEANSLDYPVVTDLSYGTWNGHIWMSTRAENASKATEILPLLKDIAEEIKRETGVEASVNQMGIFVGGWNRPARAIEIDLRGPDLNRLVELGQQIKEQSLEMLPGSTVQAFPSLELSAPELHVVPKKLRSAELQLSSDQLGYNISAYVDGAYVAEYLDHGDEIALTIVSDQSETINTADIPIVVPSGHIIPLSSVADVNHRMGAQQIMHIERQRAITISVAPPDAMALGDAIDVIERNILEPLRVSGELKGVYEASLSGTADKLMATWEALRFNLLVVLLITYLLMAALFESWLYPFVIMVSVPMAAVGGLAGLRIMNLFVLQQLDILTMLGFIILVGTVVNNAILIVHQSLNHMRDDHMPTQSAVTMSVRNRIRPIFMTTFTTTFGLIPLVVLPGSGSELYRGIGSVVLGGLITSTLFTLFLVPSLFSLTLEIKEWILKALRAPSGSTQTPTDVLPSDAVARVDSALPPKKESSTSPHDDAWRISEDSQI